MTKAVKGLILVFLGLSYLSVLALSTAHLTKWFSLTAGDLPNWLSLALAIGWEFLAFSLSLASTIEPRLRWTFYGALFVLLTVWFGNFIAMVFVANNLPLWMVLIQSSFALGPMIAGKAIGELLRLQTKDPPATSMNHSPVPLTIHSAPSIPVAQPGSVTAQVLRIENHLHSSTPEFKDILSHDSIPLDRVDRRVLKMLERESLSSPELSNKTGINLMDIMAVCGKLEAEGIIYSTGTGWEIKKGSL